MPKPRSSCRGANFYQTPLRLLPKSPCASQRDVMRGEEVQIFKQITQSLRIFSFRVRILNVSFRPKADIQHLNKL